MRIKRKKRKEGKEFCTRYYDFIISSSLGIFMSRSCALRGIACASIDFHTILIKGILLRVNWRSVIIVIFFFHFWNFWILWIREFKISTSNNRRSSVKNKSVFKTCASRCLKNLLVSRCKKSGLTELVDYYGILGIISSLENKAFLTFGSDTTRR